MQSEWFWQMGRHSKGSFVSTSRKIFPLNWHEVAWFAVSKSMKIAFCFEFNDFSSFCLTIPQIIFSSEVMKASSRLTTPLFSWHFPEWQFHYFLLWFQKASLFNKISEVIIVRQVVTSHLQIHFPHFCGLSLFCVNN